MKPIFDRGTLLLKGVTDEDAGRIFGSGYWRVDRRVGGLRCDACLYHEVRDVLCRKFGNNYHDEVLDTVPVRWKRVDLPSLRPEQERAIEAWRGSGGRGVIVMPTGTGKTEVAPVRDLMYQWHRRILHALGFDAGIVGNNLFDLRPVTVTTYDSAAIHGEQIGNRFSMVIFDEVHHLPGRFYREGALASAAPFRMGLTATPERTDGRHVELDRLVGKTVFRQDFSEARGKTLADYEVIRIPVALTDAEQERYDRLSSTVRRFISSRRKDNPLYRWKDTLAESAKDLDARRAKAAYLAKRKIENEAFEKFRILEGLFRLHSGERVIVFAGSNPMAVKISTRFLVPSILSHTGKRERLRVLEGFASGKYSVVVANRVLDEGVDVPEAKVAIVVGGLGSTRQAKQRLGRVLRRSGEARAVLYEVVCETSTEIMRSRRRDEAMLTSEHAIVAYERGRALPDRLSRKTHAHYAGYAKKMLETYRTGTGLTRKELHEEVERIFFREPDCDQRRVRAFCKLLDDASVFDTDRRGQAAKLRLKVFSLAAPYHPLVEKKDRLFESEEAHIKNTIAKEIGQPWEEIERGLYYDIIDCQRLVEFKGYPCAEALLARYNVAQTQACLYMAVEMTVEATDDFKTILRYSKLSGLLHEIARLGPSRYRIVFSGPASILRRTRRYGVCMARFLPALLVCRGCRMQARVLGPYGRTALLELSPKDGLTGHLPGPDEFDSSLEERFARKFGPERGGWKLLREGEIIHHGQKTFVPDFVFRHEDGTEVPFEIAGYWTPEYLSNRIRTLRFFKHRNILVAAPASSARELEGVSNPLIVYKTSIKLGPVIKALEEIRQMARGGRTS